jgi:hypothetical protein
MSERHKPHNGRDLDGRFKVKQEDVEDKLTDGPEAADFVRDDVRLGGAVEDTGVEGARRAEEVGRMIEENREDVARLAEMNGDLPDLRDGGSNRAGGRTEGGRSERGR